MVGHQAKQLADRLRDLAIAHVKPQLVQLEISDFKMTESEWIVITHLPDSQDKPHMSSYNDRTRFTIRDGRRKREMIYEEIQKLFLSGPQEQMMARLLSEIAAIGTRLGQLEQTLGKGV